MMFLLTIKYKIISLEKKKEKMWYCDSLTQRQVKEHFLDLW